MISLLILGALFAVGAEVERKVRGARISVGYYASGADAGVAYHKQLAPRPKVLVSPLPGVSWSLWSRFVKAMRTAAWNAVGPGGALGGFALRAPALYAVGLLDETKRQGTGWAKRWKAGRSESGFLASKSLQYRAFMALCVANAAYVAKKHGKLLGRETQYGPVTLSGVLAVLAVAGRKGAAGWFKRPEERERYPLTTAAFQCGNGVF